MTREELSRRLKGFSAHNSEIGICCYVPEKREFVTIYFGGPYLFEEDDECAANHFDSAIMMNTYEFDGTEIVEQDVYCFDYSEAERRYGNDITLAVYDALFYIYKKEIADINVLPIDLGCVTPSMIKIYRGK